jgi:hypothetical protein
MNTKLSDDRGQAVVVTVVFLASLSGAVALTLDVGSWFREHRQAQSTADAAALAGAQALPQDPAQAYSLAQTYGDKNGANIEGVNGITFQSAFGTNDTVTVKVRRTAPGFFSKLFGIDNTTVHATAVARAGLPNEAKWAAPIVVNKLHPYLTGQACGKSSPCFKDETVIPLGKTGAPGAFALVNLDDSKTGTIGKSVLADWILRGFDGYLPLGEYLSDPGAAWNDSIIQGALQKRFGTELLFPVYDTLIGTGQNAEYHVIGWVGFHVESVTASGSSGSITGYFTRVIWDGIQNNKNPNQPDFGVRTIGLVG